MTSICFYFQVHQPHRIRRDFNFFSIGSDQAYEDDDKNCTILRKVAEKCYLPMNQLILELIHSTKGQFKVAYSISGTALDQFETYNSEVLKSFQTLAQTGCVEFICETNYHSLAFVFSKQEFKRQVEIHQDRISSLFGTKPRTFRNTELIYNNDLAHFIESMGFDTILTEGVDRILDWRSPNFVYQPQGTKKLKLLLKNHLLSDDIAFRFSNRDWLEWPLTASKFAHWLHQTAGNGDVINLFMDYETFGEHQWESSGIFEFMRHLPEEVLRHKDFNFKTPSELAQTYPSRGVLDIPNFISWADSERDLTAWLGNHLQDAAAERVYGLEKKILASKDSELIHAWRKLQTSDHFYYMCIKWFNDGDVHKYFNPYDSPFEAFVCYLNAINQIEWAADQKTKNLPIKTIKKRINRHSSLGSAQEVTMTPLQIPQLQLDDSVVPARSIIDDQAFKESGTESNVR